MKGLFALYLLSLSSYASAWTWQDLWLNKDQQGQKLMQQSRFKEAQSKFSRPDWQATAAYRSGNYQQAAQNFSTLHNEEAYYNLGNALAHLGRYEEAISAYNKAISLNAKHQDALHNRRLLQDLLKRNQEKKEEKNQDKQNQDKQNQDKQNQDKQNQDKQNQDKQNQDKQNQDKQNQDKQNQDKQNQDKQNQDKQNQDKQNQDKQNQDKQNQDKQNQPAEKQNAYDLDNKKLQPKTSAPAQESQAEKDDQQAKEQWLRLIPDDPGGLLREKFLRDHLRRHNGWAQ
jgi:Ca-activated chloride channel family protein